MLWQSVDLFLKPDEAISRIFTTLSIVSIAVTCRSQSSLSFLTKNTQSSAHSPEDEGKLFFKKVSENSLLVNINT